MAAGDPNEHGSVTGRRATATDLHVGSTVDKYTIVKLLGRGGMGSVYEARHARLSRRFAIKFLLPALAQNADILRRFENEAKAAGGLEHPNLAAVTDVGQTGDGSPYLVMEYLEGEDCGKLLSRLGPLPVARVVNIVQQACWGLAVVHKASIVHRDLKPANLFMTDAGDGSDLVKVLDFGIAKLKASESAVATGTGEAFGTAHYMSPEQARGAAEVDARTDVWSLGVVLYELLSGRKPFEDGIFLHVVYQILSTEPPSVGTLRKDLPAGLVAVVARAMAKDPGDRFPSVLSLAQALAPFAADGKAAGGSQRSEGFAATLATPATGIWPRGIPGLSEFDAGRGRDETPAATSSAWAKIGKTRFAILIVVVAAGAVLGVWKMRGRQIGGVGITTESSLSESSAPREADRVRATERPTPAPIAQDLPSPIPTVATSPSGATPSSATANLGRGGAEADARIKATSPSVTSSVRTVRLNRPKSVRTVSEHSEHGSNSPATAGNVSPGLPPAPREGTAPAPKPAPSLDTGSPGHPINIDETSPYGR